MFRILHLSDIHIGRTYKKPNDIAYKIASDIDYNGLSIINCIVVTGDIFDGRIAGTDSLINTAVNFFENLLNEINSNQRESPLSKEDIIFVPGNHDLIKVDDFKERWRKYDNFLKKFYGDIPAYYFKENYSLFKEYKEHKIAFVGFNSCEIKERKLFDDEYIKKFKKNINKKELKKEGIDKNKIIKIMKSGSANEYDIYGNISITQIKPIAEKTKKLNDYTIIALFHHHFYLFPETFKEFGDSSIIHNYTEVMQYLKYMNINIVLHGHKHFALERPLIMGDYYESNGNIINIFAGGSVGAEGEEEHEHTFAILDLYGNEADIKLRHNKFVYRDEDLQPIVKKQIPPKELGGRIIKLLEILKMLNYEKYEIYRKVSDKMFKSYDDCNKITDWVSKALTGFDNIYKYFDSDYNNILFLLYAIHYRTIYYMKMVGKEELYFQSVSKNWMDFYDTNLQKTNFTISKDDYNKMFNIKNLKELALYCDNLLNLCNNKESKNYLAFTMLGIFFTDLYLVLTKYADDFKESIKYKVNIEIKENKFHQNVPAARIVIESNIDRRSIYINLLCNEAVAYKMAVLFIKEFDLLINKFEDYFKIIGLKLYYIFPKIETAKLKNKLDNYNFEAYIPTLIPLLTGKHIYSSELTFGRELIQNSIDAISVREEKDNRKFSKEIKIELNIDEDGRRYFRIIDHGIGMDKYKIERYLTSIGRSFYSSEEYEELNISYKPISNFGIGFLASFMVCQEIVIKTKYYMQGSEGLKLHIPNYDGCFFVEHQDDVNIGTEITLYLDSSVENRSIVEYIKEVVQDAKYNIKIEYLDENLKKKSIEIRSHSIRKQNENKNFEFFIPFFENGDIIECDYSEEIITKKYIQKYKYGMLIRKRKCLNESSKHLILNSGILIKDCNLWNVFGKGLEKYRHNLNNAGAYNDIILNFPSNWIKLDVARERIIGFSNIVNEDSPINYLFMCKIKIAEYFYKQVIKFIEYFKGTETNIPAICMQDILEIIMDLCQYPMLSNKELKEEVKEKYYKIIDQQEKLYRNVLKLKYTIQINFFNDYLSYKIFRNDGEMQINYDNDEIKRKREKWIDELKKEFKITEILLRQIKDKESFIRENKEKIDLIEEIVQKKPIITLYIGNRTRIKAYDFLINILYILKEEGTERKLLDVITLFLLSLSDKMIHDSYISNSGTNNVLLYVFQTIILEYFHIGLEEKQEIKVRYDELKKL